MNHTLVYVVGSPLVTDDDRRGLPALYLQDLQGGNPESKHEEFEIVDDEFPAFFPDVIDRACANYARFMSVSVDDISADAIMMHSPSFGNAGWSTRLAWCSTTALSIPRG